MSDCSILKLGCTAKKILTEEGMDIWSAGEAYQQLSKRMERDWCKHTGEEKEYKAATKEARRSTAPKFLLQLVTKRQRAVMIDQEGKLCMGECMIYTQGCRPPERWASQTLLQGGHRIISLWQTYPPGFGSNGEGAWAREISRNKWSKIPSCTR